MNIITVLHNKAMEFADEALLASMEGNTEATITFFEKAFFLEKEAVDTIPAEQLQTESYYILLRSATNLAIQAGKYEEADLLITLGLSGNSPAFIQQELSELNVTLQEKKQLLDQQKVSNHIQLVGIIIDANASKSQIKIQDIHNRQSYTVLVPQHLLNEIIKSYWADPVQIKAKQTALGHVILEQIDRAA